ncbi:MAG: PqqD family protein [Halieaceae bacterium]|jgi:hypothetical protein|nr:PqqD family protein [Halieaceae bacterium]
MPITANTQLLQSEGLDVHEAEDGLIVFDAETDKVHHLNPTAGVIFELCSRQQSRTDLETLLIELYETEDLPLDAVRSTVQQLADEGVLTVVDVS